MVAVQGEGMAAVYSCTTRVLAQQTQKVLERRVIAVQKQ
jgi:hypothetical protein